jgi:hypothetical protein
LVFGVVAVGDVEDRYRLDGVVEVPCKNSAGKGSVPFGAPVAVGIAAPKKKSQIIRNPRRVEPTARSGENRIRMTALLAIDSNWLKSRSCVSVEHQS